MPILDFTSKLRQVQSDHQSYLCVGLDPDPDRLPEVLLQQHSLADAVVAFNTAIIEATADKACAFKVNFAFYEALGPEGYAALERTLDRIPATIPVIADAKRGDIGNSAQFYAEAIFDQLDCDACTVSPYMGADSIRPFLEFPGRAAFVLARTSNAGAEAVQERTCDGAALYEHVARLADNLGRETPGTVGLVVGATVPSSLARLRALTPSLPFLIPGVGAQGGEPEKVMEAAATAEGAVLINSSRGILYASKGADFAEAAGDAAESLRSTLEQYGPPLAA